MSGISKLLSAARLNASDATELLNQARSEAVVCLDTPSGEWLIAHDPDGNHWLMYLLQARVGYPCIDVTERDVTIAVDHTAAHVYIAALQPAYNELVMHDRLPEQARQFLVIQKDRLASMLRS